MKHCLTLWTLAVAALAVFSSPSAAETSRLYQITDTDPVYAKASAEIQGMAREVEIALDPALLDTAPETLVFDFFDRAAVKVPRTDFKVEREYTSWVGEVTLADGGLGYIHLVDHGDQVSGILNLGADRYQILAVDDGHRLLRIESPGQVCGLEGREGERAEGFERQPWGATSGLVLDAGTSTITSCASSVLSPTPGGAPESLVEKAITTIDVLAVYPPVFFGSAETTMKNFVQSSESLANSILSSSGSTVRFDVVATVKLTAQGLGSGSVEDALVWLNTNPQEIVDLRFDYSADLVAIFVPNSWSQDPYCAIANLPNSSENIVYFGGAFQDKAYTAHRSGCGLNDYTFAHELGHNFGMRHQNESTTQSGARFSYGRGHHLSYKPWSSNANGTLQTNVSGNFLVGYHFTPIEDIVVTKLGGLFPGTKQVRLHEKGNSQVLRSAYVTSNNTWQYSTIGPIPLEKNTTYTVLIDTQGNGSLYSGVQTFPRTYKRVRIEGSTAISTVSFPGQMPTNTVTDTMYGAVDIEAEMYSTVLGCIYRRAGENINGAVCERIPYFSNPSVSYMGIPTGTSDRNNRSVIQSEAACYKNFRTNPAPNCVSDNLTVASGNTLSVTLGGLLSNDTDPEGDSLYLQSYETTTAQGGSNDTGHTGGFNYTPPGGGFTGTDWFSYTVRDRNNSTGMTDTCTVYVNVTP